MNPVRLRGSGYARFPEFEIEIPTGTTAIVGPNGAGKSRLLNAIELCLFADGSRDLAQWVAPFTDRMTLELEFDHDGDLYRVRRSCKAGARPSATLDLEVADSYDDVRLPSDTTAHVWQPLTRETARETQAELERLIGLSRRTFGASAFLQQGSAGTFPEAEASVRKKLLAEILDPRGQWVALEERAKADASEAQKDIHSLAYSIEGRTEDAEQLPVVAERVAHLELAETGHRDTLAAAETTLEQAQAELAGNAAAAERVKTCELAVTTARQAHEQVEKELAGARMAANQVEPATLRLAKLHADAAKVTGLEERLDEQRKTLAEAQAIADRKREIGTRVAQLRLQVDTVAREIETLTGERAVLADRLEHLRGAGDSTERCTVCDQLLGAEARQTAITVTAEQWKRANEAVLVKQDEQIAVSKNLVEAQSRADAIVVPDVQVLEDLSDPLAAARAAAAAVPTAEHNLSEITRRADGAQSIEISLAEAAEDLRIAEHARAQAAEGVKDSTKLTQAVTQAREAAANARRALDDTTAALIRGRQDIDRLRDLQAELIALRSRRDQRQADLDTYRLAQQAFGRDGVPTLIAENVIPTIEDGANRILEQLPTVDGVTLRVELRTQRELKSSDALKETLDIVVSDTDGERAYETFSGGERARLNIALRIALARLLAGRRGAESRLLAIDELEYLDELGQTKLVDVLLSVAGEFDRVVVVSHSPNVRDAFEQTIEIVKRDGVSAIASAREPVPV